MPSEGTFSKNKNNTITANFNDSKQKKRELKSQANTAQREQSSAPEVKRLSLKELGALLQDRDQMAAAAQKDKQGLQDTICELISALQTS